MKNKYIVEQVAETRWLYKYAEPNEKGESLVIELSKCEDNDSKNSLPKLWKKKGYIDRILKTYWSIETYVKDTEGNCFGAYNPQTKLENDRMVIDFDWLFEATEENKEKLINKVHELFSSAKGETATEAKKRRIKEYAIEKNIDIYKTMPEGWKELTYYSTGPKGTTWIGNGKSFKSGNRKQGILLSE